jgi:hypothetical protein
MADPKPLRFTRHAEDVILERKLDRSWIDRTVSNLTGLSLIHDALACSAGFARSLSMVGGRVLRVACREVEYEIRILTIFFDRNA